MSENTKPTIVLISGDLLFGSKVKAAASMAGWDYRFGGTVPNELDGVKLVVLDLATCFGKLAKVADLDCRRIAYGPHVAVDRLTAARQAGLDSVLTNNQFAQGITAILDAAS